MSQTEKSPRREIICKSIFPYGLDGAPYISLQVAGGSPSQNSHRALDTIFSCKHMVATSFRSCNTPGMKTVILASASPWRKELLKRAGVRFSVEVSGHKENLQQKLSPQALVKRLALEKTLAVA